jgi:outer membrane protein
MRRVWIALFGATLFAQTQPGALRERVPSMPLSLKRAVEIALAPEGNARVQIAQELIRQAESRAAQARSALLPNFESSVSYSNQTRNLRALGIECPAIPGFHFPTTVGPFNVFDVRVSGVQNIFDFSSIRRFQAARSGVEAVKAEAQGARNEVADQVTRVYLAALRAEAALSTAKANAELSDALIRLAESQKRAGTGTGIEIVRAQVQQANDRQRLIVAENERQRAHLNLLRALGLKLDGDVELTDVLALKAAGVPDVQQALRTAQAERPELESQADRESTARLNYSATKWERLPSVGFFGDYGSIGNALTSAIPTRVYGVSLRVPLFDGGRRDARRSESLSQLRTEQIRTRDVREQVALEIRLALDALQSAGAQIAAAKEGLELADRELAQARRRYEAGVASSIEVTDAQTRLQRARENHVNALFNHNLARVDLHSAMGTIQELVDNF